MVRTHPPFLFPASGWISLSQSQSHVPRLSHFRRQINHVWSEAELNDKFATKDMKFVPITIGDKLANAAMSTLYKTFNFITGYREVNPPTSAIEWRLIVLESFAGVPGFLAAAFRHFNSLRTLKRDHGAIFTFLEEAENERCALERSN